MNDERDLPVLLWPISCFDRRRENPLPVYNRWYWLNWAQLTSQQASEILAIVNAKKSSESRHKPFGFSETIVTISIGSPNYDFHMLKYRKLFTEVLDNDIKSLSVNNAFVFSRFLISCLPTTSGGRTNGKDTHLGDIR